MKEKKIAIVCVTNDLNGDARTERTCNALLEKEYEVILVGRKKKSSIEIKPKKYIQKRFNLLFNKGFFFYATYNIRLFLFLLLKKENLIYSNDLDTLPACWLAATIKKKHLIYDTHEYFTGVPELLEKKFIKKFWKTIENFIFPKLKTVITVNDSIANIYKSEFNKNIYVIRNIPDFDINKVKPNISRKSLGITEKYVIIYQGALNKDRGLEELIEAMQFVKTSVKLIICGDGDIATELKEKVTNLNLQERILFTGFIPSDELINYTLLADVGISIEKDTNINYKYCLPNKFFYYIRCGLALLISPLIEMQQILDKYDIGVSIENHLPKHIAQKIDYIFSSEQQLQKWKNNSLRASSDFNWANEKQKLFNILNNLE